MWRWSLALVVVATAVVFWTQGFRETPLRGRLLGDTSPWIELERREDAKVSLELDNAGWDEALADLRTQCGLSVSNLSGEYDLAQIQVAPNSLGAAALTPNITLSIKNTNVETALELLIRAAAIKGGSIAPDLWCDLVVWKDQLAIRPHSTMTEFIPASAGLRGTMIYEDDSWFQTQRNQGASQFEHSALVAVDWRMHRVIQGLTRLLASPPGPFDHRPISLTNKPNAALLEKLRRPVRIAREGPRTKILVELFEKLEIPYLHLPGAASSRVTVTGAASAKAWIAALMTEDLGCQVIGDHIVIGPRQLTTFDTRAYPLQWAGDGQAAVDAIRSALAVSPSGHFAARMGNVFVVTASSEVHWACEALLTGLVAAQQRDAKRTLPRDGRVWRLPDAERVWEILQQPVTWPAHRTDLEKWLPHVAKQYDLPMVFSAGQLAAHDWNAVDQAPLWSAIESYLFQTNQVLKVRMGGILEVTSDRNPTHASPMFAAIPSAIHRASMTKRRRHVAHLIAEQRDILKTSAGLTLELAAFTPAATSFALHLSPGDAEQIRHQLELMEAAEQDRQSLKVTPFEKGAVSQWHTLLETDRELSWNTAAGAARELEQRWKIPVHWTSQALHEMKLPQWRNQQLIPQGPFTPLVESSGAMPSDIRPLQRSGHAPLANPRRRTLGQSLTKVLNECGLAWSLDDHGLQIRLERLELPATLWAACWVGDVKLGLEQSGPSYPDFLSARNIGPPSLKHLLESANPAVWKSASGLGRIIEVGDVVLAQNTYDELRRMFDCLTLLRDARDSASSPVSTSDDVTPEPTVSIAARGMTLPQIVTAFQDQLGIEWSVPDLDLSSQKYDRLILNVPASQALEVLFGSIGDANERRILTRRASSLIRQTILLRIQTPTQPESEPRNWQELINSQRDATIADVHERLTFPPQALSVDSFLSAVERALGTGYHESLVVKRLDNLDASNVGDSRAATPTSSVNEGLVFVSGYPHLVTALEDESRAVRSGPATLSQLPGWNDVVKTPQPVDETTWEAMVRVTRRSQLPLVTESMHDVANRPASRKLGKTTGEALTRLAKELGWHIERRGDVAWLVKTADEIVVRGYHIPRYLESTPELRMQREGGTVGFDAANVSAALRWISPESAAAKSSLSEAHTVLGWPQFGYVLQAGPEGVMIVATRDQHREYEALLRWLPIARQLSSQELASLLLLSPDELTLRREMRGDPYSIEQSPPGYSVVLWGLKDSPPTPTIAAALRELLSAPEGDLTTIEQMQLASLLIRHGKMPELSVDLVARKREEGVSAHFMMERVAMHCCGEAGHRMLLKGSSMSYLSEVSRIFRLMIEEETLSDTYASLLPDFVQVMVDVWDGSASPDNRGPNLDDHFWTLVRRLDPELYRTFGLLKQWQANGDPTQRSRAEKLLEDEHLKGLTP